MIRDHTEHNLYGQVIRHIVVTYLNTIPTAAENNSEITIPGVLGLNINVSESQDSIVENILNWAMKHYSDSEYSYKCFM